MVVLCGASTFKRNDKSVLLLLLRYAEPDQIWTYGRVQVLEANTDYY
jgi:hypothetical protein